MLWLGVGKLVGVTQRIGGSTEGECGMLRGIVWLDNGHAHAYDGYVDTAHAKG